MGDDAPSFEIGLVMAGAVSAGAYTAGVMDFLIEALDAYETARTTGKTPEGEDWTGPTHAVRVPVVSGASAGGMTAAIAALQLHAPLDPVGPGHRPGMPCRNRLYASWVEEIDIDRLLETGDLDGGEPLRSLLCSAVLDEIVARTLAVPTGSGRAWLGRDESRALAVLLTVTNTGGVPYGFEIGGARQAQAYTMLNHGDDLRFLVGRSLDGQARRADFRPVDLDTRDRKALKVFADAALATGAFPIGLASRMIARPFADYATGDRVGFEWITPEGDTEFEAIPAVDSKRADPHRFLAVDGGMIDNEPFELTRRYLYGDSEQNPGNRDGRRTRYAAILIDPFPNRAQWPTSVESEALSALAPRLVSVLVNQARFKPQELALATNENVRSRFAIMPEPVEETENALRLPIASGALGGFSGFLHRSFRHHDYCLGRRNAQAFLRWHFCLPENNPLFDRWKQGGASLEDWYVRPPPDSPRKQRFVEILDAVPVEDDPVPRRKADAPPVEKRALPIIPLTARLREDITLGPDDRPRPDLVRRRRAALEKALDRRSSAVVARLIDRDLAHVLPGNRISKTISGFALKRVLPGMATKRAMQAIDSALEQIEEAFPKT